MKHTGESDLSELILFWFREKILPDLVDELSYTVLNKISASERDEKLLSSREVCETFNISPSTLERWIRQGLKFRNTGKRTKRQFLIKEVEKFKAIKK